jgi:ribosome-associated toxin RatA of RatAB toxin-antitoxin module
VKTTLAIHVDAPPERVFELAHDIARWPELLPHYRKVSIRSRNRGRVLAQMFAVRQVGRVAIPVTWRAEQWSDASDAADLRLHFRHVRGVTRGMEVTWHIRPHGGGARVSIEHDFRRPLPVLGPEILPALVDRLFVRPIAGRTLASFRALAEKGSQA